MLLRFRPFLLVLASVLTASGLAAGPGVSSAAGAAQPDAEVVTSTSRLDLLSSVIDAMRVKRSPSDLRYYDNGLWIGASNDCWACRVGPAVGAAALVARHPDLLGVVTATMDRAIAEHRTPSGAFGTGGQPSGIDTTWFMNALGTADLALGSALDPGRKAQWASIMAAGADWLMSTGQTTYYVNGNINLGFTESLWLAWRITGQQRFADGYEASLAFTLAPPGPTWTDRGLRIIKQPTLADGADGAGYLTEQSSAGGAPGFDPDYVQLQLDQAAALFVMSGDVRLVRVMNLLVNSLISRLTPDLSLDARNGERHSVMLSFTTPALHVLAATGARPDLQARDVTQITRLGDDYRAVLSSVGGGAEPGFYRGVGTWLAVPVLQDQGQAAVPQAVAAPAPASGPVVATGSALLRCKSRAVRQVRGHRRANARARARERRRMATCRRTLTATRFDPTPAPKKTRSPHRTRRHL